MTEPRHIAAACVQLGHETLVRAWRYVMDWHALGVAGCPEDIRRHGLRVPAGSRLLVPDRPEQTEALELVDAWGGKSGVMISPPGVGKSFACVQWLLAYARVGKTIRWEQCSAWAVGKAFDQARERMLAAHALVLDDFGRGPVSAWAIEQLNAIACTRFDSGKRTLVSSNAAHYSVKAGADREVMPLCGEPLISRMQGRIREVGGAELRGRDDGLVLAARDRARALLELVGVTDSAELPVWPGQRQQDRPLPSYDDVRFGGVLATRLHAAESDAGPTLPERDDNAEARAAIDAARSAAKREIVGQVCRELELDPREVSRLAAKLERESTDRAGLDALAEAMAKLAPAGASSKPARAGEHVSEAERRLAMLELANIREELDKSRPRHVRLPTRAELLRMRYAVKRRADGYEVQFEGRPQMSGFASEDEAWSAAARWQADPFGDATP